MTITAFVLFFVAGLGFGYAAPRLWKLSPLFFPLALALGAFLRDGVDGASLAKLIGAIVVTLIGIALGAIIDQRGESKEARTT